MTPLKSSILLLLALASPAVGQTVHVATTASLLAAIERARRGAGVREIDLASGVYSLRTPLRLDERLSGTPDAPFVLRGADGSHVVLSGNRDLPPLAWTPWKDGIWRAKVASGRFQRLWLGSRLLVRARYPNYNPEQSPLNGTAADAISPTRVARWHDPAGGVLQAIQQSRWGGVQLLILGKNPDGTLRFAPAVGNNREAPPSETDRFVENILEELDAPGEWFHDEKAGWLYFKPTDGKRPPARGFQAGATDEILHIVGGAGALVHDVRIENLTIQDTEPTFLKTTEPLLRSDWKFYRAGAVTIENADRVTIRNADLQDIGGNGVVVSGRARHVTIRGNLFQSIGGTAIAFVGRPEAVRSPLFEYHDSLRASDIDPTPGPKTDAYPSDSVASDNLIHDIGLVDKQAAGVEISMSARIALDHNSIYHGPRAGINVGDGTWGGHVITNNDVFDMVRETGDHGAYNSWGRDRYWDHDRAEMDRRVAEDHTIATLDALDPIVLRHNRFRCDHGWDIDLDDGSSNYIIEDNLLLAGGLKFREGVDRTARNNILINNTFHPHVWFKDSRDVFEQNIVMMDYQPVGMKSWGSRVDYNFFLTQAALAAAQIRGTDARSAAGDPGFVDPKHGDYRVTAPVTMAIGFQNFSMDDFGVTSPRLRAMAKQPEFSDPILWAAQGQTEQPRTFAGMTIKSVETLGEQSAAGLASKDGVLVLAVAPGSAAAKAGFVAGDAIVAIGSGKVPERTTSTVTSFIAATQEHRDSWFIDLRVIRNQTEQTIRLALR